MIALGPVPGAPENRILLALGFTFAQGEAHTIIVGTRNLEHMKRVVFEQLGVIRVYSKPPGQEPNYSAPFVMKEGGTVGEFAGKVHQDFARNLRAARVWGSAAFDGQMVQRDYVLQDGDVVELRI